MTRDFEAFEPATLFEEVIARVERDDRARREVGNRSALALKQSKKAIFAAQRRDDPEGARVLLAEAAEVLVGLQKEFGQSRQRVVSGQWRVAMEEFLEAFFYLEFLAGRRITGTRHELLAWEEGGQTHYLEPTDEEILGALSDFSGEVYRQMHIWIAEGRYDEAIRANRVIARVAELLNQNTSGGDLRRKVEQASRNLHQSDARITDMKIRGLI